tara:strand:+ start:395 stop:1207 length:813 start_codon:yes stop_codon:yes gene_type:complete
MTDKLSSNKTLSLDKAIFEYYQLKQKHDTQINRQKQRILKSNQLTLRQKKRRFQEIKKECVNCGKAGGTLFKTENNQLIAVCNASTPCSLNIRIDRGNYGNIYDHEKKLSETMLNLRESIISTKLNVVFGMKESDIALATFDKLKEELSKISSRLMRINQKISLMNHNPEKMNLLHTAEKDLFLSKEQLNTIIKEYKENEKGEFIRDAVELYVTVIEPLSAKIRELKYAYVGIEEGDDLKINLIENPTTFTELIQPASSESEAKIISFIK